MDSQSGPYTYKDLSVSVDGQSGGDPQSDSGWLEEGGVDNHGEGFWDEVEDSNVEPGDIIPDQTELVQVLPGNILLPNDGLIGNSTAQGMSIEDGLQANRVAARFIKLSWERETTDSSEWDSFGRAMEQYGSSAVKERIPEIVSRPQTRWKLWESGSTKMYPRFLHINALEGSTPAKLSVQVCYSAHYKGAAAGNVFGEQVCDIIEVAPEGGEWKVVGFTPEHMFSMRALEPIG